MDRERPCDVCRTPTRALLEVEGRVRRVPLCSAFCRRLYLETHPPQRSQPPPPSPPRKRRKKRSWREAQR